MNMIRADWNLIVKENCVASWLMIVSVIENQPSECYKLQNLYTYTCTYIKNFSRKIKGVAIYLHSLLAYYIVDGFY